MVKKYHLYKSKLYKKQAFGYVYLAIFYGRLVRGCDTGL